MQFFHLHCSVWNKMKSKCFWLKPGMSPQPPASALCHTGCCPGVRPVCTWSAPGSRMHVLKEGNSLGNHFILQGGSPWASQCLLLHQSCIVNWKAVLFPWNSPGTIFPHGWRTTDLLPAPPVASSASSSHHAFCPAQSCVLRPLFTPEREGTRVYMHSRYVQQGKNLSTEQVIFLLEFTSSPQGL